MSLKFRKVLIADERYESAEVFDANNDGVPDIVSGAYWYEGPDFKKRHKIGDVKAIGDYFDDFSTIAMDVNGDGNIDFVTGGWWGNTIRWRENPGNPDAKEWPEHVIDECGNVETTRAWDVDGDGFPEIVPNTPLHALCVYKLVRDKQGRGTGKFTKHTVFGDRQGHGLGFGDLTGGGRGEFILAKGWLEPTGNPLGEPWEFHQDFDLGSASIPIIVADVNGDGVNDFIAGQAHGFGLDWYEQRLSAGGKREWIKHPIDPYCSQYHDLHWVDIDDDGKPELVTGKRYMAHCGNDPGEYEDLGIYYFKWNGESFSKEVIDYGPPRAGKGCGIYFAIADLRGTGRLDVVAPGKDGLYVYYNEGFERGFKTT